MESTAQVPPIPQPKEVEFLQYVHPSLLSIDYDNWNVRITVMVTVMIVHLIAMAVCYYLMDKILGSRVDVKHKCYITLTGVRSIYAWYCILYCAHSMFTSTTLSEDVVRGRTVSAVVFSLVTCGFYVTDTIVMTVTSRIFNAPTHMLIHHHILVLLVYPLMVYYDSGYFFAATFLLVELPVPFHVLRIVLEELKLDDTLPSKVNTFILIHAFHMRNPIEFYLLWKIFVNWDYMRESMPVSLFTTLLVMLTIISFVMTPGWTFGLTSYVFSGEKGIPDKVPESKTKTKNHGKKEK